MDDRVTENRSDHDRADHRQLIRSLLFTCGLLGLIALAIEAEKGFLALIVMGALAGVVTAFHYLFRSSRFFAFAFANLTGVYACIFLFFAESNFREVDAPILWIGFVAPLIAFLGGSLWRRRSIHRVVSSGQVRDERHFARVLRWLLPVIAIGALTFLMPSDDSSRTVQDAAFLGAMAAIAGIILFASHDVAVFLLDTGLLFEEFFRRAARLLVPAFAFLTFYSLLVIVFATTYSLLDRLSGHGLFRIDGVIRGITFPESLYFSVITLSTVGYGDIAPASNAVRILVALEIVCGLLLLLFGFHEILTYSRERRGTDRA